MARRTLAVVAGLSALLLALLVVGAGPAVAGDKGKSSTTGDSGYTEDNDTNDGGTPNNVSDDGDNAHPSGKDRSVEKGGSGTQGKSASDPDGESNGGPDKPNGSGGVDQADQDGNNGCGNDDDFEDDNNGNCGPKDKVRSDSCVEAQGKGKGKGKGKSKATGVEKKCADVLPSGSTCPDAMAAGATSCDTTTSPEDVEGDETEPCADAAQMAEDAAVCGDAETTDVLGTTVEGAADLDDDVLGTTITNDEDGAAAAAERGPSGRALPFTGAGILSMLVLACGLLGSGLLFLRRHRS